MAFKYSSGSITATLFQFPLKVAHAIIAQKITKIYILNSLPVANIRASPKAFAEFQEMNRRSINSNPILWKQKNANLIKIASMNSMNLTNNYNDIISDQTLLESNITRALRDLAWRRRHCPH